VLEGNNKIPVPQWTYHARVAVRQSLAQTNQYKQGDRLGRGKPCCLTPMDTILYLPVAPDVKSYGVGILYNA